MSRARPNWLLRGLVGISAGIHLLLFLYISGLYGSHAITSIELTLRDMTRPPVRMIPRPRQRPKDVPRPLDIKQPRVAKQPIPSFKPVQVEPAETPLPDSLVERIEVPEVAPVSPGVTAYRAETYDAHESSGEYATANTYLEMVKLRIEEYKKYPETARRSHLEGTVTVRFVITPEGGIGTVDIVRGSRSKELDEAALDAVKSAAPFPKPPPRFFRGDITLVVKIVFELT